MEILGTLGERDDVILEVVIVKKEMLATVKHVLWHGEGKHIGQGTFTGNWGKEWIGPGDW